MTISKILVPLYGRREGRAALDWAAMLSHEMFARLVALYMRPDPVEALNAASGYASTTWIDSAMDDFQREVDRLQQDAYRHFLDWAETSNLDLASSDPSGKWEANARWLDWIGASELAIARLGRFSDLQVFERPDPPHFDKRVALIEAGLFEAGRPVFMCPPSQPRRFPRSALVAWNNSAEALHAVTAAVPLLSRTARVTLLSIGDPAEFGATYEAELLDFLECHEISAERRTVAPDRRGIGDQLLHEARAMEAELLVMGAFTHSRLPERLLGSTTHHVLASADLPVFLAH